MSANNFILITKKDDKFVAKMLDADTGGEIDFICAEDKLEDTIKKANDYMEHEEVEYGLSISI